MSVSRHRQSYEQGTEYYRHNATLTLTVVALAVLLLPCDMPAGELGLMAGAPVNELAGDLDAELLPRWCLGEWSPGSRFLTPSASWCLQRREIELMCFFHMVQTFNCYGYTCIYL